MPTLKQIFKSKTILFGLSLTILGVIQDNIVGLGLSPQLQSIALIVIGILVAFLRVITTTPLSEK